MDTPEKETEEGSKLLVPLSELKAHALATLKPYKSVGEDVFITNENDPNREVRDLYIAVEGLSMRGIAHQRQVYLAEADLTAEKARLATMEAAIGIEKAKNKELLAQAEQLRTLLWMKIGKIPEVDDRQRWKFNRKKMQDINDKYETVVITRTMDEDDENELLRRRFAAMLAENMNIEGMVEKGLTKAASKAARGAGYDGSYL